MYQMRFIMIAVCLLTVVGCANSLKAPVRPPMGFIYTDYDAPLTTDFKGTGRGSKTGQSQAIYIRVPLIIINPDFAFGDADIQHAAQNAGIHTIYYADYHYTTVIGLFSRLTVTVHGD